MLTPILCAIALCIAPEVGADGGTVPEDAFHSRVPAPARSVTTGQPIADLNGDGIVDIYDVLLFLNCWQNNLPCADLNGDGVVDIADVVFFVNA
ncbi:MAG: hypothetical protein Kow0022_06480 [Phycisphaerales bacterium]